MAKFPIAIREFADKFVQMQHKRHEADYDPYAKLHKSGILTDISEARIAISGFLAVSVKDRTAFVSWVLFRNARRS